MHRSIKAKMRNECLKKQRREKTEEANKIYHGKSNDCTVMGRVPLQAPRCHRMAGQIQISSDLESADSANLHQLMS